MKRDKTYWAITALISAFMLFSSWYSGTHKVEFTQRMGFPEYFRIELTLAKIAGVIILLIPAVTDRVKEWVYVSFGIVVVSAAIAKYNSGYPASAIAEPVFTFVIMIGALLYLNNRNKIVKA
jgi:hypothetical protein